uniref:Uncharacterized protein n=1 Tax=Spongospora subterranea TaxID=70186 RepID=A0A0H5QWH2_9EUKA|eukprot:CRZ06100.1 hypothetical protein [Spongospora subterranea]
MAEIGRRSHAIVVKIKAPGNVNLSLIAGVILDYPVCYVSMASILSSSADHKSSMYRLYPSRWSIDCCSASSPASVVNVNLQVIEAFVEDFFPNMVAFSFTCPEVFSYLIPSPYCITFGTRSHIKFGFTISL